MAPQWANRAASAEAAVTARYFARLWAMPATQLGIVAFPATRRNRRFGDWNYWWQSHLLDCLVDAQVRDPQPRRRARIVAQLRGHRLRNRGRWTNNYYDDMAWQALAIERASRLVGVERRRALRTFAKQFARAWLPELGGGIRWRKEDYFFNAPANGPAGIFLARHSELRQAQMMADWIDDTLVDPETSLIFDGIRDGELLRDLYTYCQGVVLGLETELAVRTRDDRHAPRVHRLVAAVAEHMAPGGVLAGRGGGDGGLFSGITVRYLALVATMLPGAAAEDAAARETANKLVMVSAQSAWENRQTVDGLPVFGPDWDRVAEVPTADVPERDLSVQLSGWMLMEAAHQLSAQSGQKTRSSTA